MTRLVCGIDVGGSAVRAVVLRTGLRAAGVVSRLEIPLAVPDDGGPVAPAAISEALASLAAGLPAGIDAYATAVDGIDGTIRQLSLPRAALRQIDAVLALELEGDLPFEISDAVFDHTVTSQPSEDPARLLVVVVRGEAVRGVVDALSAAGLDPESVSVGASPFGMLLADRARAGRGEPECVVDFGRLTTDLAVFRDGRPVFLRSFRAGAEDLTRAMMKVYRIDRARAEASKRHLVIPDAPPDPADAAGTAALRAADEGFRTVVAGLRRALLEIRSTKGTGTAVSQIRVTGGGSRVHGLAAYLAGRLDVEVEPLSALPAAIPGIEADAVPEFGRAAGIALSVGAARARLMDLRKGDLRYRGDAAAMRSRLRGIAAAAAVLVAAWGAATCSRCRALDAEAGRQREALAELTADMMGKKHTDFGVVRRLLDKADRPVEGPMPQADVLDILAELSRRMPADIRNSVTLLHVEPGKLTMNGLTKNAEEAARIPKVLGEYADCVQDVGTLSGSGSPPNYTYQIEATTRCP